MKKILVLLAFIAFPAFGQHAKQTNVKAQDQNYKINLNISGTPTDVVTVQAAIPNVTQMGPMSAAPADVWSNGNGIMIGTRTTKPGGILYHPGNFGVALNWNYYRQNGTNNNVTFGVNGNTTQASSIELEGANGINFRAANGTITTPLPVVGNITLDGLWTIGPTTNTTNHLAYGGLRLAKSGNQPGLYFSSTTAANTPANYSGRIWVDVTNDTSGQMNFEVGSAPVTAIQIPTSGIVTTNQGLKVSTTADTMSDFKADTTNEANTFTAIGGGSISGGTLILHRYSIVNKMMTVVYWYSGFTVSGTVTGMSITIPASKSSAVNGGAPCFASLLDNSASVATAAMMSPGGNGATTMFINKLNQAAWSASTSNSSVGFSCAFPIL